MKYITDPSLETGCYCCNKSARTTYETDFEIQVLRRNWSISPMGKNVTNVKEIIPKYCPNCGRLL